MRRRRWLEAALGGLGAAASSCGGTSRRRGVRLVLVTLDTLRADALFGRGGGASPMPRLWRRARRGVVLENYFTAAPLTQPTHATLLTGLHPWEHGLSRNGVVLAAGRVTIAQRLRDEGFRTAAVVAAFPLHRRFGFDRGFEVYRDEFHEGRGRRLWEEQRVTEEGFRTSGEDVTRQALELLDAVAGPRQFFWFHYFDAHAPYGGSAGAPSTLNKRDVLERVGKVSPDPQTILAKARQLYDLDAGYLDEALDLLLSRLDQDRARFETHVLVVSDHGESFGEGDSVGHGQRLTREQLHVPCVLFSSRRKPGVEPGPVGAVDLTATLLSLAGSDSRVVGGRDLLEPRIPGDPVVGMRRAFVRPFEEERLDGSVHVLTGPRFYVLEDGQLVTGDRHGVTLEDSQQPLDDPDRARRARRLFEGFEAVLESQPAQDLTDRDSTDRLRALGYVP